MTIKELIDKNPQLKDCYDYDRSYSQNWLKILVKHPELADYCDFTLLTSWETALLLSWHPHLADRCDFARFDEEDWALLLSEQPQFIDRCDCSSFSGEEWVQLLVRHPQLAVYCDFAKLSGHEWACLFSAWPRFFDRSYYGKLSADDWNTVCKELPDLEKRWKHEHDEFDYVATIGNFAVHAAAGSDNEKKEKGGQIQKPHLFTVMVRGDEGKIPHFHVHDAAGEHRKKRCAKKKRLGIHTCIEILQNRYFRYGAYQDNLEPEVLVELDKFMSEVRTEGKYCVGIGMTNYELTIGFWNEENNTGGTPHRVDIHSPKPDFTTLID